MREDKNDKVSDVIYGPYIAIEAEEESATSNINANVEVIRKEQITNNLKEKIISIIEDDDMRVELDNKETNTIKDDTKIIAEDNIAKEDNKGTNNFEKCCDVVAQVLSLVSKLTRTQKVNTEKEDNKGTNNIEKGDDFLVEDDIEKDYNKGVNNIEKGDDFLVEDDIEKDYNKGVNNIDKGDDFLVEDDIEKEDNKGVNNIEKGDDSLVKADIKDVGLQCDRFYPSMDNLLQALKISLNFDIPPGYIISTSYCQASIYLLKLLSKNL
jgi:hypothetical protein